MFCIPIFNIALFEEYKIYTHQTANALRLHISDLQKGSRFANSRLERVNDDWSLVKQDIKRISVSQWTRTNLFK